MTDPIAIRKLIEGVTPGEWRAYHNRLRAQKPFDTIVDEIQDEHGQSIVHWSGFDACKHQKQRKANARFIAAARTLVPQLLDEVERLTAWRPISTAPKDGTPILVCIAGVERSSGEAYWWQSENGPGGWQTWDGANHTRTVYVTPPTHWRPLPTAARIAELEAGMGEMK